MNWREMEKLNQATLDQIKDSLSKAITTSTGQTGYDLKAPAYELYPVLTPIRNATPRIQAAKGSAASNWKVITGISPNGSRPFVAEGARNAEIAYSSGDRAASYRTWGRDDSVTDEADAGALAFDDLRAKSTASTLRQVMMDEEDILIGAIGNQAASLALGVTPAVTVAAAGTGATLPAATYVVYCVALTYMGLRYSTTAAIPTFAGSSAGKSAASSGQAVTLGQTLSANLAAPVRGAVAYAWYVGTAGNEKLEKITAISSATFSAPLAGTGQAATAIGTSDNSQDSLACDGMLSQILYASSGAYVNLLATGVAGTGTLLTSDGAGGIVELDSMLQSLWDNARVGPDVLYVNSQQMKDINKKILVSGGAYRFNRDGTADAQSSVVGGSAVVQYVNKFLGTALNIKVHPTMPAGSIVAVTHRLPDWYPGEKPAGAWDFEVLKEYHDVEYARTTRKWEHGVYVRGTVRGWLPLAQGFIGNIAPG